MRSQQRYLWRRTCFCSPLRSSFPSCGANCFETTTSFWALPVVATGCSEHCNPVIDITNASCHLSKPWSSDGKNALASYRHILPFVFKLNSTISCNVYSNLTVFNHVLQHAFKHKRIRERNFLSITARLDQSIEHSAHHRALDTAHRPERRSL